MSQTMHEGAASRTKRCAKCKVVKPWGEFYMRSDRAKPAPMPRCRKCAHDRVTDWKERNPDKRSASNVRRNQRIRDRNIELLGNPIRCAICGRTFEGEGYRGPHFDHNHETGEARGWLCPSCNKGIGALGDNPRILRAAAAYLETRGHYTTRPRLS